MARGLHRFLVGIFDSEDKLLKATREVREAGAKIHDVYTPYPVHGIDEAAGIRRTRLGVVTFITGLIGFLIAMGFEVWSMAVSWPMDIGGKPYLSIPAYIPVSFELTVLIGGLSTVLALLIRTKLFPGQHKVLLDSRVTDDRFVLAIDGDTSANLDAIKNIVSANGALEIKTSEAFV